jgi:hypothetical protein
VRKTASGTETEELAAVRFVPMLTGVPTYATDDVVPDGSQRNRA